MRSRELLKPVELNKLNALNWAPETFALVTLTPTKLIKDSFNATLEVREYFSSVNYHDFKNQNRGDKTVNSAFIVSEDKVHDSEVALHITPSKREMRMRITHLNSYANPGDTIILIILNQFLHVFNLTKLPVERISSFTELLTIPIIDVDIVAMEGNLSLRQHLYRERDKTIVKSKKLDFKNRNKLLFCEACQFNFEQKYGSIGEDFIECHHTVPLSSRRVSERTSLNDLRLLCSNCHRMVHRKNPPLTFQQLLQILKRE